jgi:hypothetical protein
MTPKMKIAIWKVLISQISNLILMKIVDWTMMTLLVYHCCFLISDAYNMVLGDDDDDESEADDIRLPVREIYSRPTVEIPVHRTREFKVLRSCSTPKSQERQFLSK